MDYALAKVDLMHLGDALNLSQTTNFRLFQTEKKLQTTISNLIKKKAENSQNL